MLLRPPEPCWPPVASGRPPVERVQGCCCPEAGPPGTSETCRRRVHGDPRGRVTVAVLSLFLALHCRHLLEANAQEALRMHTGFDGLGQENRFCSAGQRKLGAGSLRWPRLQRLASVSPPSARREWDPGSQQESPGEDWLGPWRLAVKGPNAARLSQKEACSDTKECQILRISFRREFSPRLRRYIGK